MTGTARQQVQRIVKSQNTTIANFRSRYCAPLINQSIREKPATTETTTIPTAIPETTGGHTNHGATAATEYKNNSIVTRIVPGVGTTTLFLSFGVENTEGRTSAGRTNHLDQRTTAHVPAIHVISSDKNRTLAVMGVSCGCSNSLSMILFRPS